jgi:NADH-quinone oxidoreductase subunit L
MLIGSLAIAGIPPLAGFFSKDEILGESFKQGYLWVWAIGFVVAGMTAFYMFRLMGLTFWGAFRGPKAIWDKIHESPPVMTIPLVLLAIASVFLGMFLGLPFGASRIAEWLAPVFEESVHTLGIEEAPFAFFGIDGVLILASVTVAVIGIAIAWRLFGVDLAGLRIGARPERVRELSARVPFLYRASLNKWWFDELNHLLFIVVGGKVANGLWWFDREVVDGTVNLVGRSTIASGRGLRRVQTGRVQNYALGIAVGLIVMAGSYLLLAR